MAAMTPGQARVRGVLVFVLGLPVLALGAWLLYVVLGKPMPDWLPEPLRNPPNANIPTDATTAERLGGLIGMASLFLVGFGTVAAVQGLGMLVLGRRSRVLLALMFLFFLILIGSGLWISVVGTT